MNVFDKYINRQEFLGCSAFKVPSIQFFDKKEFSLREHCASMLGYRSGHVYGKNIIKFVYKNRSLKN